MSKVYNFSAGPCILPQEVLKEASEAVSNFDDLNLSLIEISHRSKNFVAVMDETVSLVKELLNVPDNYDVVFLQGGASLGFIITAYNLMRENGSAAYLNTGAWANKAQKEAAHFGNVVEVASSKDKNYSYIPKGYEVPSDADYFHCTSNNTIYGTQIKEFPTVDVPLVCDMSSDIFSKPVDVSQFDLIYAGAQKNMGPAGSTLYIIKKDIYGRNGRSIPSYLNLKIHADKDSMFNTPPVFPVYVSMLTLRWLKANGGVEWIQERNEAKAALLYGEIDRNPLFNGVAAKEDRSNMNATFVLANEAHKETFDQMWNDANISGIKGHRSVGGYRASMYNAMDLEGVQALVNVMKELENRV
ncbi:MAG: 3-phosphoserine/phosphohydroxythreonine transaminase [Crocinitomicaceae bacterium]|nr:3-phosphoserine/phosphohydroxythreonine transaminase [Crocinitomicaceae bacterium]|tara:strand:- start:14923 stop:15993 length:1071 start_codon:yes stop_codon:yes gene_type:complete